MKKKRIDKLVELYAELSHQYTAVTLMKYQLWGEMKIVRDKMNSKQRREAIKRLSDDAIRRMK